MISIVMAYYNRRSQLLKTLESIKRSEVKDVEIIVVDDASTDRIEDLSSSKVIRIEPAEKWWSNPVIPYNIGLKAATGDIIVIQNPECYHNGDILKYVQENLKENQYISFGCYSLTEKQTPETVQIKPGLTGRSGWFNHSVHRPVGYHFCSAIHRKDLEKINEGGFDKRFAEGIAYDDDAFWLQIGNAGIQRKIIDTPFVFHQFHSKYETKIPHYKERLERNEKLFKSIGRPFVNVMLVYKSGGDFHFTDVDLIASRLHENWKRTDIDLKVYCLNDIVKEVCEFTNVTMLPFPHPEWRGWWSKLNLFSPELNHLRPFLFMDLDTLINGDVSAIIPADQSQFIMLEDFYQQGKLASGVMWIPNGEKTETVWGGFKPFSDKVIKKYRGDGEYIRSVIKSDVSWPRSQVNTFKPKSGKLTTRPEGLSLVCFHGKPRIPEAAKSYSWVNDYYRGRVRQ